MIIEIIAVIYFIILLIYEISYSLICFIFYNTTEYPIIISSTKNYNILNSPYTPIWWAQTPYLQTLLHYCTCNKKLVRKYKRIFITISDGSMVALDIKETSTMNANTPIILMCHGLFSSSENPYIHGLSDYLSNYRTIVYNRKGHGNTSIYSKLPTYTDSADLQDVINYIKSNYTPSLFIGFGLSAGANLLLNYIGTNINTHCFDKLVTVSNIYTYNILFKNLHFIIKIYFLYCISNFINQHSNISYDTKCIINNCNILLNDITNIDYLIFGKTNGFKSKSEYYKYCSSLKYLQNINIPLLNISSLDDPLIHISIHYYSLIAAFKNKNITLIFTKKGGHVSWVDRYSHSWSFPRIYDFITHM